MRAGSERQWATLGVLLFAANEGHLDDVDADKIVAFEKELLSFANSEVSELISSVDKSGKFDDEVKSTFTDLIAKFKKTHTY